MNERLRQPDALEHALRIGRERTIPTVLQPDQLDELVDLLVECRALHAGKTTVKTQRLVAVEKFVKVRIFGKKADAAARLKRAHRLAKHPGLALRGFNEGQ